MITAWRIYHARLAKTALGGEGARLFGGRWNSRGTAVVYLAQSQSLAALEMLIHLEAADALKQYQIRPVAFDESLIEEVDLKSLPANWAKTPAPRKLQKIGDNWIASRRSLILRVPSAIVPAENNFLLNPNHPDFDRLIIGRPQRFKFDRRFFA